MDDQEMIRDQMENTRTALSEKLEELENRVTAKVEGATQDVAQTVETVTDSVQETVETVKDTVEETISAVKEGVGAVKRFLDLPAHVDRYPWIAMGASVALGYCAGEYLSRRNVRRRAPTPTIFAAKENLAAPLYGNGQANSVRTVTEPPAPKTPSWLEMLKPELNKLKGLALGVLMGTVRETVAKAAGDKLGHSLAEVIDSATEKIGGTRLSAEAVKFTSEETPEQVAI